MTDQGIVVLGIPIPSSSPVFLAVVAVHVAAGITCVVAGLLAMLAPKAPGRHPAAGTAYFWSLLVVSITMTFLAIVRWPADNHLLVLGIASATAGALGRWARRSGPAARLPWHAAGMALSYILLLTAFYVDNGPHLPLWRRLPPMAFWVLPALVGLPILGWVLRRHPLLARV